MPSGHVLKSTWMISSGLLSAQQLHLKAHWQESNALVVDATSYHQNFQRSHGHGLSPVFFNATMIPIGWHRQACGQGEQLLKVQPAVKMRLGRSGTLPFRKTGGHGLKESYWRSRFLLGDSFLLVASVHGGRPIYWAKCNHGEIQWSPLRWTARTMAH